MDHYKTLGVLRSATDEEIKKAYRKQAMLHHPDRHAKADAVGKKMAEDAFKKAQAAYEILSNPTKRTEYDWETASVNKPFGGAHRTTNRPTNADAWQDSFRKASGKVEPSFEERFRDFETYMNENGGYQAPPWHSRKSTFDDLKEDIFRDSFAEDWNRRQYTNKNVNAEYAITMEESYHGKTVQVKYETEDRKAHIEVTIPQSIKGGTKLRVKGGGERKNPDSDPGDFFLLIKIKEDDSWTRVDDDLELATPISILDLAFGTKLFTPTIDGEVLAVDINPGTQLTTRIRIPGRGMKTKNGRGDMYLKFVVEIPKLDPNTPEARAFLDSIKKYE